MKINGGGSNIPVESMKNAKTKDDSKEVKNSGGAKVIDSVDARLSRALKAVEDGIYSTGLTAAEVHSNMDENRIASLLRSLEHVEAKGPSLGDDEILSMADRVASEMAGNVSKAMGAHNSIDGARVFELTEG